MSDRILDKMLDSRFDYMEIVFCNTKDANSYDIPEDQFMDMMFKMKKANYKYFQTDSQDYIKGNKHMKKKIVAGEVQEVKVYNISPLYIINENKYIKVAYEKQKLSSIMFPSIDDVDTFVVTRKLIFRVNNKVYVNFQLQRTPGSDKIIRKVYINFNNSRDTDIEEVNKQLDELITLITASDGC
jgi:hypothetical protein